MKGMSVDLDNVVEAFVQAALAAGDAIMALAADNLRADRKLDGSPVTRADLRAEEIIREHLAEALPALPIIGEEGDVPSLATLSAEALILVDPLDGTRDFLGGSPEFTVNIALVEKSRPVAGVVYAPALGRLFAGKAGRGAFEMEARCDGEQREHASRRAISVRQLPSSGALSLESRSHPDEKTRALIAKLAPPARREVASSLKFGLIAAGEGDLYARGVSLNQWDIAAGDAVLTAAGGAVLTLAGEPIAYGGASLKAPPFVAIGDAALRPLIRRLSEGAG
jgi:3'(2'), 5'-bisphosphate nucleotidase